jgi:hypothetical protein
MRKLAEVNGPFLLGRASKTRRIFYRLWNVVGVDCVKIQKFKWYRYIYKSQCVLTRSGGETPAFVDIIRIPKLILFHVPRTP